MFVIAGTFDVQTTSSYSVSSVGVVCVECELVPWTQAQGCHMELDCDNGDVIEQDFFTSSLPLTSGCFASAPSAPTFCTLLFYDLEQSGSASGNPALTLDDVLVPGIMFPSTLSLSLTIMGMATTSTPSETGREKSNMYLLHCTTEHLLMHIHS